MSLLEFRSIIRPGYVKVDISENAGPTTCINDTLGIQGKLR